MIRVVFHFILLIVFTNFSYAQNSNVTIKEIRGYNGDACWFCSGRIVVLDGQQTDTGFTPIKAHYLLTVNF